MHAAVHQFGRKTIINGQHAIAKPIVETKLDRVAEMLARAVRKLALDPQDADMGAAPVRGCCKIEQIAQDESPSGRVAGKGFSGLHRQKQPAERRDSLR